MANQNDINKVVVVGNLCRDAEVRYMQSGSAVASFSIAVNASIKQGDSWTSKASFFDVTLFGKRAEALQPYLKKGTRIGIDGHLDQQRWEKDGQKFSKVVIIADAVELLSSRGEQSGNTGHPSAPAPIPEDDTMKEDIPW